MRSRVIVSFLCLFTFGCPQEPKTNAGSSVGAFDSNLVVRLDSPINGATVQSPFAVEYTVGPGVDSFELKISDVSVEDAELDADGQGSLEFEVDHGRHRITLEGWDSDGTLLNEHRFDVNVVDMEGPWVTTPTTGAVVSNPVRFGVEASEHIDSVEIQADEWPLNVGSTQWWASIDWNAVMLELIDTCPTDGSVTYDWTDAGHGTTMDIYYKDEVVASAGPGSTSFCCGITFEIYMRAFAQIDAEWGGDGLLNGMSVDDVLELRRDWFVRDLWGDGPGVAFENYGLGETIVDWADILPGDPVQFWRFSGGGHSVIFIDWVTDTDGTIVGLDYWSTQPSTNGIGYGREYFGTGGSDMDPAYFYAARAWMPSDWLPW
jgi:hypothetical protein